MAKRRTRKDKSSAKHNILISWSDENKSGSNTNRVKGQSKKKQAKKPPLTKTSKNTDSTVEDKNIALIKKDIAKSLSIAGLILGVEMMIYFVL